jgi:hypothetical protein
MLFLDVNLMILLVSFSQLVDCQETFYEDEKTSAKLRLEWCSE